MPANMEERTMRNLALACISSAALSLLAAQVLPAEELPGGGSQGPAVCARGAAPNHLASFEPLANTDLEDAFDENLYATDACYSEADQVAKGQSFGVRATFTAEPSAATLRIHLALRFTDGATLATRLKLETEDGGLYTFLTLPPPSEGLELQETIIVPDAQPFTLGGRVVLHLEFVETYVAGSVPLKLVDPRDEVSLDMIEIESGP